MTLKVGIDTDSVASEGPCTRQECCLVARKTEISVDCYKSNDEYVEVVENSYENTATRMKHCAGHLKISAIVIFGAIYI